MSKKIQFDLTSDADCVIDPGEHEIRLSFDQIQIFSFLALHGKNIITAYRENPKHHNHCPCCGPEKLNLVESEVEDLMLNMAMFFEDLYIS